VLSSTERFRNGFFRLVTDEVRLPAAAAADRDGSTVSRDYVSDHLGAVAVVAYDEASDAVVLVRQYRHPVRRELWELPAGLLDVPGESALDCAKRELAEEADLVAARWDVLVDLVVTPGSSDEAIRIFLARELSDLPEKLRTERLEEEAGMLIERVPLAAAVGRIFSGDIENAACVAGLLALQNTKMAMWPPLRAAEATWPARPGR
jgi:ADP-ribose pyrophosphatase